MSSPNFQDGQISRRDPFLAAQMVCSALDAACACAAGLVQWIQYMDRGDSMERAPQQILAQLYALQDLDYRAFHLRLIPTVSPQRVLGVRILSLIHI